MPDLPKAPYIVSFLALGGSWKSSKSLNRIIRKWSIVGKTKKACPFQKNQILDMSGTSDRSLEAPGRDVWTRVSFK